jgi:hypothetical protein
MKKTRINIKRRIPFLLKIGFSLLFLFAFVIYVFSLWNIKVDAFALTLVLLIIIPWFIKHVQSINIPGLGNIDINKDIRKISFQQVSNVKEGENELKVESEINEQKEVNPETKYLSFRARINYINEAGGQTLLKILIDDNPLTSSFIINREFEIKTIDGRVSSLYNENDNTWKLIYSPDFVSNYSHTKKYKVTNQDPYLFIFDISSLIKDKKKINIVFVHAGNPNVEAFRNSIILRDIVLF